MTSAREYEPEDLSDIGKRWEGRTVEGKYRLESYLGGSDHSAVFLTKNSFAEAAAIKLIFAETVDAEKQFLRWKAVRELSHPNLIRIFEAGRCELDGTKLLYVVEEYAEENLSQILPERALTAEETRGMLPAILGALQFVHDKGLVHGRVQPSNILATGDQVKLSSDTVCRAGERRDAAAALAYDPPEARTGAVSPATDSWQLGMTLTEVLTQRLPVWDRTPAGRPEVPALAEPFGEIVANCLQVDPANRWTIADVAARLGGKSPRPRPVPVPSQGSALAAGAGAPKASKTWLYLLGLAIVVVLAFILIARLKPANTGAQVQQTKASPSATAGNSSSAQVPAGQEAAASAPAAANAEESNHLSGGAANPDDVVARVVPEMSAHARRTVHGRIIVRVKVKVDAEGDVDVAKLESPRASRYFKNLALEAARDWKFSPAQAGQLGAREWKLQFTFSRAKTEAAAVRVKR